MKKIIAVLSAAALIFAAVSCASTDAAEKPAEAAAEAGYVEPTMPAGEEILLDDFSEGNYWDAVGSSWDNDDAHQNLVTTCDVKDEVLVCEATVPESGSTDSGFYMCNNLLETDWTDVNYIACDVENNCGFPLQFTFTLQCTDGWTWHQFQQIEVPEGKHTVLFDFNNDLIMGAFEDAEDKNVYLCDVKRLNILVFASDNVNFNVDNVRIYR